MVHRSTDVIAWNRGLRAGHEAAIAAELIIAHFPISEVAGGAGATGTAIMQAVTPEGIVVAVEAEVEASGAMEGVASIAGFSSALFNIATGAPSSEGLKIVPTNSVGHFEIVPQYEMPFDVYQGLLNQIICKPFTP